MRCKKGEPGLIGGSGPDEIGGGPGTPDGEPLTAFSCGITDDNTGIDASTEGNQVLIGEEGNDRLTAGRDNDFLGVGPAGTTSPATAAATASDLTATRTNG